MASNADVGFGVSVTFQSGFFAWITNVRLSGYSREAVETTHAASTNGWAEFIASDIKNAGQLQVDISFDPDDTPPIDQAAETITVTFPIPAGLSNGATLQCTGFMIDYEAGVPIEGKMTASATLKFSGEPTWSDAS